MFHDDNNFNPLLENSSEIIKQNEEEEKYCEIYIRFPSFSKKIIHCIKSPEDCINKIIDISNFTISILYDGCSFLNESSE